MDQLEEINQDLKAAGLPALEDHASLIRDKNEVAKKKNVESVVLMVNGDAPVSL